MSLQTAGVQLIPKASTSSILDALVWGTQLVSSAYNAGNIRGTRLQGEVPLQTKCSLTAARRKIEKLSFYQVTPI